MLRCTIEIVPFGNEALKKPIGIVEIANDGTGDEFTGNYRVVLLKTPPWHKTLMGEWKKSLMKEQEGDSRIMAGKVEGFDRIMRGPYDLLYRALKACGLERRN